MKTFAVIISKIINGRNIITRYVVAAANEGEAAQHAHRRSGGGVVQGVVRV